MRFCLWMLTILTPIRNSQPRVYRPVQAVRIRQVADPMIGDMPNAVKQIVGESGWGKLYEGLPSILFRQISFGMMKFLVFDFFTGTFLSQSRFKCEFTRGLPNPWCYRYVY